MQNSFRRSVGMRSTLASAIMSSLLLTAAATASAQTQAEGENTTKTLDQVTVTGSRIRGAQIENQQPVQVITRKQIEQSGFTSIADLLQNNPSSGAPAISRADALASGEDVGGYYVDIRNLGSNRTLVLVNGQRLGVSTSGSQDLSQIPLAAVERIDILKDGASSIYGSDAIAAVVNVVTRKRFDGAEVSAQYGQFGQGDGGESTISAVFGKTFDRGGFNITAERSKSDPILASERWFSADGNAGPLYPGSGWSPISQNGSAQGLCGGAETWCTLAPGGDPSNAADYIPLTSDRYANSNEQMYLQTGVERKSVLANVNYDLTDRLNFNADILYNERTTDQQIAGYPYQSGAFDTPLSADSAFNPIGEDLEFRRRLWEVPRSTESELKTFRFATQLSGGFDVADKPWNWEVGFLYNRNKLTKRGYGDASLIATRQALGPSFINADGVAQCGSAASPIGLDACRPWNPLLPYGVAGQGSLADSALQDFLFPITTDTGKTTTKVFSASLTGALLELPAGDLGFAVGAERREEQGSYTPDAFAQTGEYTGLAADTTLGEYSVNEAYAELNIPVLADKPFAKELTFNLASRYSHYSNFGTTVNHKVSGLWRPTDTLNIRGTWAEGFRAPSINDLYGGTGSSFEEYTDPCSVGVSGSVAGNAACSGAGVPASYVQLGQGLQPCTSWPCATPDQFITGSNPDLEPETSKSWTAGIVWSPDFARGLDLSLDWWRYKLSNAIISDSVDRILRDCYVLGNSARCEGIVRESDGHISQLFYGLTNLGHIDTEGWDIGVRYRLADTAIGSFNVDWQTTYTSKYNESGQNSAGDDIEIGLVGQPGYFRIKSNLNLNWQIDDQWGVNWKTRYYSGISESCVTNRACSEPDHYANGESDPRRKVGSNTFHDLQLSYQAPWNATIAVGVNNVFDHYGPILYSGGDVSTAFPYYPEFDIGRFGYMRYTQRF
ncbi:iron complex outermembrane recepter protein [Pseudoxanthomonas sp. GM95]|nr:iron complex outermembrane recepter protein [Pseudoxanthomonas sp. GM95]